MKITIVTLFPEMVRGFVEHSIVGRAQKNGFVTIEIVNLRDFATDNYKTVDDKPYGGGAGMVLRVDVLAAALNAVKKPESKVYLTSAKGAVYNQRKALELSGLSDIVIVAGHYEGVDERVLSMIDEEISLGDYVVTGGEIAAVAITDSVVRLLPGVLKKAEASDIESFKQYPLDEVETAVGAHELIQKLKNNGVTTVTLLEYPHYTRPEIFNDMKVPEILVSGHHADIRKWRIAQSFSETVRKRPDLLDSNT